VADPQVFIEPSSATRILQTLRPALTKANTILRRALDPVDAPAHPPIAQLSGIRQHALNLYFHTI
jgi:hypothetical protein